MATYGRPGVYTTVSYQPLTQVNSVPGGSIPAIAAEHPMGPLTPQLVQSWKQFVTLYGSYADSPGSILPFAVNEFFTNNGSQLYVLRVANTDASAASLALEDIAGTVDGALTITANSPGTWGENIAVTVSLTAGSNGASYFNLQVYFTSGGVQTLVETFPYLSMNPADPRYCVPLLNSPVAGSNYITVADDIAHYAAGQNDLVAVASPQPLQGGTNGTVTPDLGTVVPQMLDTIEDQIMAVNLPGESSVTVLNELISWASTDGDKMIVIDGPEPVLSALNGTGYSGTVLSEYLAMVQSGSPTLSASPYGALYGPWLLTQDPSSSITGATRWLPPGPAVLAQWQVNDTLVGPWQTPAGINYQVNALAMETSFSNAQLDTLNEANVNVIRQIPGYGFCIFGGNTLAKGYPDQFISVQREMMALEHDMTNLLQFALFEPNGPALWASISDVLDNYLQQQFQAGVFAGSTAATSFQVICDASNNTPQSAQSGLVNISVLVALMSPAEFLQLDLTQTTSTALTPASS